MRVRLATALLILLAAGCAAPRPSWVVRDRRASVAPEPLDEAPAVAADRRALPAELAGGGSQWREGRVHVVRPGETLFRVARAYGVDPDELADLNEIADPARLGVGRELLLPAEKGTKVASVATAPKPKEHVPAKVSVAKGASADTGPAPGRRLAWPLQGVIVSRYGPREGQPHDGLDLAAPEGTPIGAAADGIVLYAGNQRGYGNLVILRHDAGLVTVYAHNRENLVREGVKVRAGDPIATVGRSGRATGPHLHLEVREGTRPRDPLRFLRD